MFQQLKAKAETQFHTKLKSIQTDWGEVFRSMTSFLNTNGILHRVICPHTHYQNGVVNSHFIELGLTLLKQASLPLKIWKLELLLQHPITFSPSTVAVNSIVHTSSSSTPCANPSNSTHCKNTIDSEYAKSSFISKSMCNSQSSWHIRLGHPNSNLLKLVHRITEKSPNNALQSIDNAFQFFWKSKSRF